MSDDTTNDSDESPITIKAYDPERDNKPALELMIGRARAIQAYAYLEFCLSSLFATLLRTDIDAAGIVFYRIINTRSRNRILDDLKKKRYGSKYSKYWNSLLKNIAELDQRRNEIVHWHVVTNLDVGKNTSSFNLSPPASWATNKDSPAIDASILDAFSSKAKFVSESANYFMLLISGHLSAKDINAWGKVFQQPLAYPPPETHPLSPNYKARENPSPSPRP